MAKKCSVRLLTKTLAVLSLLASTNGNALGIGEIKLHSALNQNLNAEISLTLSGESASDIKVSLAAPEKFDQAGVAWTSFLSKIKFQTITHSNGSATIKLTSTEALKEPFLDFLLEVSWPKGNLYREFTVLVDPPSAYNQATRQVPTDTEQHYAQPSAASSSLPYQTHSSGQNSDGEYGPTLGNDTLWSVAERAIGSSDISVEQMMMAIYDANPQAFYKGNVHALMSGKMLKMPTPETASRLSRHQALAEFAQHTKAWRNHSASDYVGAAKRKPALNEAERPAPAKIEKPVDNQLTLLAPNKVAPEGRTVVAPVDGREDTEQNASDTSSASPKAVKSKTALSGAEGTKEGASAAASADNDAIQSKIAVLEKQLAMMQELIALKDQQLAALQNQAEASRIVQPQPASSQAAKPAEQSPPAAQAVIVQPVAGEVVASKPADQASPPATQPVVAQPAPSEVVAAKPADHAKPAAKAVVKPTAQAEADSLIDPYYISVGGIGTVVLSLLGWLLWRKRKVDEETNTESMFASSGIIERSVPDENISVPIVEDAVVRDTGVVGESSFLSEFTPSDFDSFDTDQGEIDPVSEADVYLAYGRYQQAEELIRQAIKDQPNRDECKLKLLEIFYANENKAAFEAYANELAEAGKQNEAGFWEQAAEMGREICPDSPLFSSGGSAGVSFAKETTESKNNGLDFDLATSEVEEDSPADEPRNNQDIDFDLSSFSMDSDEDAVASNAIIDKSPAAQIESFDFDLSSFPIKPDEADKGVIAPNASVHRSSASQAEDLDFDLSSFSLESNEDDDANQADQGVIASNTASRRSSATQTEDLDFDLSSFSLEPNEEDHGVIAANTASRQSSVSQIEDLDFDLSSFSLKSDEADQGVIASNPASDRMQTRDIDFELGSFSTDTDVDNEDKDFAALDALSDIVLETKPADKQQGFEAYALDFNADNTETQNIEDVDFNALERDDKNIEFSEDELLDLNDDFDFNFDLETFSTKSGQNFDQYKEFGVSDLTDMDELETKLDLAKAYVDMGDADAAKDIAKEVLEQGTVEQKKTAKALLDELN
ncbi:MAG: FimV/HubP family polar landmark protein [Methylococcaceae bacterium]